MVCLRLRRTFKHVGIVPATLASKAGQAMVAIQYFDDALPVRLDILLPADGHKCTESRNRQAGRQAGTVASRSAQNGQAGEASDAQVAADIGRRPLGSWLS